MKIAFDAKRLFNNHTGLGNYSRTVVNNLNKYHSENQYALIAPHVEKSQYLSDFARLEILDPKPFVSSFWRSYNIYKDINDSNCDIFHGLSNELPFSLRKVKAKKIVTIHDLFYARFPDDFSAIDRRIYKVKTEFACRNADHIIAISEATKADIVKYTGTSSEKVTVLYQSYDEKFDFFNNKALSSTSFRALPDRYFLYVGSINKRKNLIGILEAMKILRKDERIPLVVVGNGNKKYVAYLHSKIEEWELKDSVFFLGSVPKEELKSVYVNADFTCLPSFYEGFGIPIIESLACGTPVITSKTSALPEAAGPCGLLVDPASPSELSSCLHKMSSMSAFRAHLKELIPSHLQKFSGKATSNSLDKLYKSL